MSKEIKDILSIYEEILSNKNSINEVADVYDNVNFKDYAVGNSSPSKDNINISLLNDIQKAAKNAGVTVDVTTAVSGHNEKTSSGNTSRHPSGNAVDIAIINNKPVSVSNRADADKFVDELVKLGYTKNSESGNSKAVLTFGFQGHDDHVHVSNLSNATTQSSDGTTSSTSTGSSSGSTQDKYAVQLPPGYSEAPAWAKTTVQTLTKGLAESLNESTSDDVYYMVFCNITQPTVRNGQDVSVGTVLGKTTEDVEVSKYDYYKTRTNIKRNDYNFGKDVQNNIGNVIIPNSSNPKIKSPVSGKVVNTSVKSSCKNQIVIQFTVETKEKEYRTSSSAEPRFKDPALGALLSLPAKIFTDKYDKSGSLKQKRFGYPGEKVDPWIKDAIVAPFKEIGKLFKKENKEVEEEYCDSCDRVKSQCICKKKKVDENIERIKKLLK